ncbi:MAG: hypothetical protein S4CHLAM7_06620 [Chlamydiae bacterium]|nr:hypothetical protein [Chlamydiota bacterium]
MTDKELESWRLKMDELDNQLLMILSQRVEISNKIMSWKKGRNAPLLDSSREAELLDRLEKKALELQLSTQLIREIYALILRDSKEQ